ncbi:hypothetical protein [Paraburkholderia ribeironis]|uniref:hypothetical protein n=1 Tax=Paraburkholderia ribeironis TaxID=1247936 RepID=UPI001FE3F0D9|nr:hypothetical protein [Paraburkholderia ribeironis]
MDLYPAAALRQSSASAERGGRLHPIAFPDVLAEAIQPFAADLLALLSDLRIAICLHIPHCQEFILHDVDDDRRHDDFHYGAVHR